MDEAEELKIWNMIKPVIEFPIKSEPFAFIGIINGHFIKKGEVMMPHDAITLRNRLQMKHG